RLVGELEALLLLRPTPVGQEGAERLAVPIAQLEFHVVGGRVHARGGHADANGQGRGRALLADLELEGLDRHRGRRRAAVRVLVVDHSVPVVVGAVHAHLGRRGVHLEAGAEGGLVGQRPNWTGAGTWAGIDRV